MPLGYKPYIAGPPRVRTYPSRSMSLSPPPGHACHVPASSCWNTWQTHRIWLGQWCHFHGSALSRWYLDEPHKLLGILNRYFTIEHRFHDHFQRFYQFYPHKYFISIETYVRKCWTFPASFVGWPRPRQFPDIRDVAGLSWRYLCKACARLRNMRLRAGFTGQQFWYDPSSH